MSFNLSENSCPSEVFRNMFFYYSYRSNFLKNFVTNFICQTTKILTMPSLTITETIQFELDLTAGTFLAMALKRQSIC